MPSTSRMSFSICLMAGSSSTIRATFSRVLVSSIAFFLSFLPRSLWLLVIIDEYLENSTPHQSRASDFHRGKLPTAEKPGGFLWRHTQGSSHLFDGKQVIRLLLRVLLLFFFWHSRSSQHDFLLFFYYTQSCSQMQRVGPTCHEWSVSAILFVSMLKIRERVEGIWQTPYRSA